LTTLHGWLLVRDDKSQRDRLSSWAKNSDTRAHKTKGSINAPEIAQTSAVPLDNTLAVYYYCLVIVSFRDKDTEQIWDGFYSRRFPPEFQRTAKRKLIMIHAAISLMDLQIPPGNRLHILSGKRKGQHSISINDQWRICFEWKDGNAHNVEITDYHS
jgi:proteic killer suppression protein